MPAEPHDLPSRSERADPARRRQLLAQLLKSGRFSTQEALLEALRAEGLDATQATLSRDLARLGARRVAVPGGGTRYELADELRRDGLEALRGLVASVGSNGSLVVVRTHPGSAPAVARAIDLAEERDVLGTVAGDDTIFVAPARERGARALADRLAAWFGVEPPPRA